MILTLAPLLICARDTLRGNNARGRLYLLRRSVLNGLGVSSAQAGRR